MLQFSNCIVGSEGVKSLGDATSPNFIAQADNKYTFT